MVTNRNHAARPAPTRSAGRVMMPLLFVVTVIVAAGCFQNHEISDPAANKAAALRALRSGARTAPVAGLGADDPGLGMDAVAGATPTEVGLPPVQALPGGNPSAQMLDLPAPKDVVSTTLT